jgi:hypothetical protein
MFGWSAGILIIIRFEKIAQGLDSTGPCSSSRQNRSRIKRVEAALTRGYRSYV